MITETLTTFSSLLRRDRRLLTSPPELSGSDARTVPAGFETPQRPAAWGLEVLTQIEWRRFEALMEAFFQQAGLMTRTRSLGPGQGVDIWLYSRHQAGQAVSVARCRQQMERKVLMAADVAALKETMTAQQVAHGQWVVGAAVEMSQEARALAKQERIQCMDAAGLLAVIKARPQAQQAQLLAVALQGDYWRPTCPGCGFKMVGAAPKERSGPGHWACASSHGCQLSWPAVEMPA